MKKTFFLLLLWYNFGLNGQELGFSDAYKTITGYESCKSLEDSVRRTWKAVEGEYYKSAFSPKRDANTVISYPCMTSLKRPDVNLLFGKPNKAEQDADFYFTSKPFKNYVANSFVRISYLQSRLTGIREFACPGTDKFVRSNFQFDEKKKAYKCSLLPKTFGTDSIKNECLLHLSKDEFIVVFGKPSLQLRGEAVMGMQKVEWDEKGQELRKPARNNQVFWLRYITDTIGRARNSGYEVRVYPDPAHTTFITYNCSYAADTLAKKWKFDPDKGHFECRMSWMEIDLAGKCLYGYGLEEIKRLFGAPSKQTGGTLEYYLRPFPANGVAEPDRIIIGLNERGRLQTLVRDYGSFVSTID